MRPYVFLLLLAPALAFAEHPMLRHSGLPIPRFVALKSSEINLRAGPGRDYPIKWVYHRQGLPIEVIGEFGHWREVRDIDQETGWMHSRLLTGERSALITPASGLELAPIYKHPSSTSQLIMEAQKGAMLGLRQCIRDWCQLYFEERAEGWAEKKHLWGVYPQEVFED